MTTTAAYHGCTPTWKLVSSTSASSFPPTRVRCLLPSRRSLCSLSHIYKPQTHSRVPAANRRVAVSAYESSFDVPSGTIDGLSVPGRARYHSTNSSEYSERFSSLGAPFDICPVRTGMLKTHLLMKNREGRNEVEPSMEGQHDIKVLRPGMVILKGYLDCNKQVHIVKKCRELGLGSGGFFQPSFGNGGKMKLKMMCLGKNWDHQTGKYGDYQSIDGAKPPDIPNEFYELVSEAIKDSHAFLMRQNTGHNVNDILPSMQPNICIVNFYEKTGRLGLHQDKDETPESLRKGLPVVSFSIGDSAVFLYGNQRYVDRAAKVVLDSGDVVIFGGKSRRIFHGVTSILADTAPNALLEATNLRPGRLNLTFREY